MSIGKNGVPNQPIKPNQNPLQPNGQQNVAPTSTINNTQESVQEYSIRVPKNGRKKFNLMRFNGNHNIDFIKWTNVKMERENNMKEYRGMDEDQPKFGAGSEFGRDQREEARRKKLGFNARKYKPEAQPWLLKSGGKNGKKFKGIREGGVSENASYYVFTHAADGAIEAFPLQEWYNFTPIQTYKALSAEEAEQEFGKRNRVLNFFSLMMRKRLRGDEDIPGEDGASGADETKGRKSNKSKEKELKISEMDEWMETSSDDDSDDDDKEKKGSDDEDKKNKKAAKGKEAAKNKKKKQRDTDAEAIEDSDDGDEEGRELDYISSSSESEVETEKQLQGVSEEKALRKLLTSDEDSDDDENKSKKDDSNEDSNEKDEDGKDKKSKDDKDDGGKKKKKSKKKDLKKKETTKKKESSSDFSSDSDTDDGAKKKKDAKKGDSKDVSSATNSRSPSPNTGADKRKLNAIDSSGPAKKAKLDMPGASLPSYLGSSSDSGITEEAVRRYLMRKPMTTTELLQKFKTKKTGLNSEQLVNIMTQILKKINPVKQTIKGKMYLSIKQ